MVPSDVVELPKEAPKDTPKENPNASPKTTPLVQSVQDLLLVEAIDGETETIKYVAFYHITSEEEVYFGQLSKSKWEITVEEFNTALQRVPDTELYPEVPENITLTIAPDHLDDECAFLKRPGLVSYDEYVDSVESVREEILHETAIMEQISKAPPHPHIIRYLGCRVRRGRITCIFLERLDQTLMQYSREPEFAQLNKSKFMEALESAVAHVHSLGLAHNDIKPDNIMVRDGMPVLIDFGSCQPFGVLLKSGGTEGWCIKGTTVSGVENDTFGLQKVGGWLETGELPVGVARLEWLETRTRPVEVE